MVVSAFVEASLLEVVKGIGRLFLNPALYVFFMSCALVGYFRMNRERKEFSFKVYDMWYELRTSLFAAVGYGLCISVVTVGAGFVFSEASLLTMTIWMTLFALVVQYRYISPAYTVSIAIAVALLSSKLPISFLQLKSGEEASIVSLAILLGGLLVVEGLLISKQAAYHSVPKLRKGKRGLNIGLHEVKRLWMVPVFVFVPGEAITQFISWWPVVSLGQETYSIVLVPFLVGFARTVKGSEPKEAILFTGRRVLGLAVIVLILGAASYFSATFAIIAMGVAMLGRFTIAVQERIQDENREAYFAVRNNGLVVLGVIPNTAGSDMGLQPGELIAKVNGSTPTTVDEFYSALQSHTTGAFCKLEVIDTKGERRLVHQAIYAGEHHELGVVFVEQESKWDTEVV